MKKKVSNGMLAFFILNIIRPRREIQDNRKNVLT